MTAVHWHARVRELCALYELPSSAGRSLVALLDLLATDPRVPSTVTAPEAAVDVHLADSLVALALEPALSARTILDIGSGAGFPGLPLAVARPDASVTLLESNGRKCEFLTRAIDAAGVENAHVVRARAEGFEGAFDVVTARALAPLSVVAEYAAPVLACGGTLIAWRGKREPEEEASAMHAADELGLSIGEIRQVQPFTGVEARNLHLMSKVKATPARFPRRTGVARKRPLGRASDRKRR
ncbi:MAG TPA: 16S rRNA (guanine(527)-N(7))-methyltransferase RsmG [Solirubrobacteraceae bacterium]|nr:16S rRNA (guanine(527)-N(7))-methyltransferase RsmG [Solirubrobacteraceae bacterium]